MDCYAGIGSRVISDEHRDRIISVAKLLSKDYTLRSGGAEGADSAFEQGCDEAQGKKEIFLPWKNFNGNKSEFFLPPHNHIPEYLVKIASEYYPRWNTVPLSVQKFHARNVQQILGKEANDPVRFVVCCTNRSEGNIGGTTFGMLLARMNGIHVYNIYKDKDYDLLIHAIEMDNKRKEN